MNAETITKWLSGNLASHWWLLLGAGGSRDLWLRKSYKPWILELGMGPDPVNVIPVFEVILAEEGFIVRPYEPGANAP